MSFFVSDSLKDVISEEDLVKTADKNLDSVLFLSIKDCKFELMQMLLSDEKVICDIFINTI